MIVTNRDILLDAIKEIQNSLRLYKNSRKKINITQFGNVLNKDRLGKERREIYMANGFFESAFDLYKGRIDATQVKSLFESLIGYEFNVYLYKVFSNFGVSNIEVEQTIKYRKNKTDIDVIGNFKQDTLIKFFSLVNNDLSESELIIPKGYNSFEAKAMDKVTNDDIHTQLEIATKSDKFDNSFGVILLDTAISRDLVRETNRIGAQVIRVKNMPKKKIINNVLNIFRIS